MARRVLLLSHWIAPGGMEQQLLQLALGLAERGDDVTIGCFRIWKADTATVLDAGARIVTLGESGRLQRMHAAGRIARLARRHDVVHCTGWDASLWGRIGGALARRPVVVTDHSTDRSIHRSLGGARRDRLVAWHNRVLDPVTYATVAVAERQLPLLRSEGVTPEKIVVIPNGVALARLRDAAAGAEHVRAALGVPPDAKLVLHAARWQPVKRQELTYDAVRRLRDEIGDVHVVFAGHGTDLLERARVRARAEGATWAHFLGARQDVPALLRASDLAVLPSSSEALPMTIIEAMALGTPQVATDVGDVGRLLRDTGAGVVVDRDDATAFADACRRVLTDADLAGRLRAAALEGAERFDAEAMIDAYRALFAAAAEGRPPRSALG